MDSPSPPLPLLTALWKPFLTSSLMPSPLFSPFIQDKRRRYSMLHSQESGSSVFSHSQDEGPSPDSGDCAKSLGAPFNLKQAKDAQPSSGDSTTSPSKSAAILSSTHFPRGRDCYILLNTYYVLSFMQSHQIVNSCRVGTIVPILQMRKLRRGI